MHTETDLDMLFLGAISLTFEMGYLIEPGVQWFSKTSCIWSSGICLSLLPSYLDYACMDSCKCQGLNPGLCVCMTCTLPAKPSPLSLTASIWINHTEFLQSQSCSLDGVCKLSTLVSIPVIHSVLKTKSGPTKPWEDQFCRRRLLGSKGLRAHTCSCYYCDTGRSNLREKSSLWASVPHGRKTVVSSWQWGYVVEAFHIAVGQEGERARLGLRARL